jgi:hypothetical protein
MPEIQIGWYEYDRGHACSLQGEDHARRHEAVLDGRADMRDCDDGLRVDRAELVACGAGTGLGVGVAILGALGPQDGYVLPSAKAGAPILLSAVGALIGILIDRAHHPPEHVLYLARRGF